MLLAELLTLPEDIILLSIRYHYMYVFDYSPLMAKPSRNLNTGVYVIAWLPILLTSNRNYNSRFTQILFVTISSSRKNIIFA